MTTKSYTGLKEILIDKLEAITGGDEDETALFVAVYGSNVTEPDGYPIAYVVEKGGDGVLVDTHRNERVWEFTITIHQALGTQTIEESYATMLDALDRVIVAFDQDPMLADENGQEQCKRVEVMKVADEKGNQDTKVHRALLTCRIMDLVPRYAAE